MTNRLRGPPLGGGGKALLTKGLGAEAPIKNFVLDRLYHLLFSVRMSGNCLPALFIKSSVCFLHSSSVPSKIARHGLKSSRTEWVWVGLSISLFSMNLSYHMG